MRASKVLGWIVGAPVAAFAISVAGFPIKEHLAPDETFASSAGLSIAECRRMGMAMGAL